VTERARLDPEHKDVPASGAGSATVAPTGAARVLTLQRTAGNRAVGHMLARETATKPKTGLERLDELLDKFNVDEDAVIAHLGTLSDPEKAVVLRDYRARVADPLNTREMVRAIKTFKTTLWQKLVWVGAAGTPDYGEIRELITSTTDQKEKSAIGTKEWRAWFVAVCSNATMKQAVVDLGFRLPTQLWWIDGEMSADYGDIRFLCQAKTVTDDDRKALKTKEWRDWFVGVCGNATMRDAVVDLKFDAVTKVDWLLAEGTDTGLLRSALLADGKATDHGRVVSDPKLIERIRCDLDAEGVRTVDQVQIELAKAEKAEEFTGFVDVIPEARLQDLHNSAAWLKRVAPALGDKRFAALAARIMLVARHAPGARREALRVLTAQLQDSETALRMITKPVQAVIVPRDKMMTELDEFKSLLTSDSGGGPGNTFDGRPWKHVRGVGNVTVDGKVYAAITEENLLGGLPDARTAPAGKTPGGYTPGYSTTSHEFAHVLHRNGLSDAEKKLISKHWALKRAATNTKTTITLPNVWPDGPRVSPTAPDSWKAKGWDDAGWLEEVVSYSDKDRARYENYSSQNDSEYFAQLSNAYLGTNLGDDPTTGQPRNNGRAWVAANEHKDMLDLLDKVYKHQTINDVDAAGKLTAGGLCTNPDPKPAPPPPGPPPPGAPPPGGHGV
jgi:hypothetical protein